MADELSMHDATEGSPFLENDEPQEDQHGRANAKPAVEAWWSSSRYQVSSPNAVVGLLSLIIFFMALSGTMGLIPLGRLIEDAVCRKYYGSSDPVDEKLCKVDEVQTELAWLGGLYVVIDSAIGFIVSFPWGITSDRLGRKPVFRLSFLSLIIGGMWTVLCIIRSDILPIRLMLLSPLFTIFGGGIPVFGAVINSMIADVTGTERTSGFLWLSLGAVTGAVAGPGLSAKLMEATTPWIPLYITGCISPFIFVATIFLPETRPRQIELPASAPADGSYSAALVSHVKHTRIRLAESVSVLRSRSIAILLLLFFVHAPITMSHGQTIAQTISKRFHWTLAQTGYLFSVKGIVMVVVLALMPFLSSFLTSPRLGKYQLSIFKRDLRLAQLSLVFLIVGSILMGGESLAEVITGLVVSTFAIGIDSLVKSLIASYVDKEHTSRLYALTGMTETAGRFFGAPSLAWTFERGVKSGWMGLPFYFVAGLCALALVALCFVQKPNISDEGEQGATEV
ncbi:MFS general substrate transporter [Coniochaeta ligniaria NRRL 30616]|uniref:MFS general substrate transporter n=1 Tax=Coniochaeta ligniaria NRRL 30616 TaxID=1408157 RepID=A0A1J7IMM5_9PEZI|nr:MFS general substrate transporter [Coniochaeta ligniaria NRRL 30616]